MKKFFATFTAFAFIVGLSIPLIGCSNNTPANGDVLRYAPTANQGEWIITGIEKENGDGILQIPETLEGKPVTEILSLEYRPNNEETSLHFTQIERLGIPKKVKTISPYVCRDMVGLQEVYFSEGSQLEKLDQGVFMGCKNLHTLDLPSSLKYIYVEAFDGCEALTSLHLPKHIEVVAAPFKDSGITELTIEEENEHFSIVDSVLYDKNKTTLFYYPAQKPEESFTVLDSVDIISGSAFYDCKNLKTVNLNNVSKVEREAFEECENLATITADSLKYVDGTPFDDTAWWKNYQGEEIFLGKCLLRYTKFAFALDLTGYECIAPYAFKGHTDLHRITFDDELINIGEGAFMDCTNLYEVLFYNPSKMVFISQNSFENNATNRFFKVHESLFNEYATYNNYATNEFWQPYKDRIKTFN